MKQVLLLRYYVRTKWCLLLYEMSVVELWFYKVCDTPTEVYSEVVAVGFSRPDEPYAGYAEGSRREKRGTVSARA